MKSLFWKSAKLFALSLIGISKKIKARYESMVQKKDLIKYIMMHDDLQTEEELNQLSEEELSAIKLKLGIKKEAHYRNLNNLRHARKIGGYYTTGKKKHKR